MTFSVVYGYDLEVLVATEPIYRNMGLTIEYHLIGGDSFCGSAAQ